MCLCKLTGHISLFDHLLINKPLCRLCGIVYIIAVPSNTMFPYHHIQGEAFHEFKWLYNCFDKANKTLNLIQLKCLEGLMLMGGYVAF